MVVLHSKNLRERMSALGHKRTLRLASPMSALPPKADIGTQSWNVRFVPKAEIRILFDQLIGALLEKWGHVETEQLGCLEIDH